MHVQREGSIKDLFSVRKSCIVDQYSWQKDEMFKFAYPYLGKSPKILQKFSVALNFILKKIGGLSKFQKKISWTQKFWWPHRVFKKKISESPKFQKRFRKPPKFFKKKLTPRFLKTFSAPQNLKKKRRPTKFQRKKSVDHKILKKNDNFKSIFGDPQN